MTDASNPMTERGLAVRRDVLGTEYVDNALNKARPAAGRFQHLVSTYCWGELWSDDTLDRRQRSLINVAMIAALGRAAELRLHVRGAVRNGCTEAEINEALMHAAVYAGIPAGVEGFRIAKEVLEEEGM